MATPGTTISQPYVWETGVSRQGRAQVGPWLLAVLALAGTVFTLQAAAVWFGFGVAGFVAAERWSGSGHGMSEREWRLLSAGCASAALWTLGRHLVPWSWALVVLLLGTVGFGMPWWHWRRVRPVVAVEPPQPPKFLRVWGEEIVPKVPDLAGSWLEWDDEHLRGVAVRFEDIAGRGVLGERPLQVLHLVGATCGHHRRTAHQSQQLGRRQARPVPNVREEVPGREQGTGGEAHVLGDHGRMVVAAARQIGN